MGASKKKSSGDYTHSSSSSSSSSVVELRRAEKAADLLVLRAGGGKSHKKGSDSDCSSSGGSDNEGRKSKSCCSCWSGGWRGCGGGKNVAWRASRITPLRIAALIFFALGVALLLACMFYTLVDAYSPSTDVIVVHSDLSGDSGVYVADARVLEGSVPAILMPNNREHEIAMAKVVTHERGGGTVSASVLVEVMGPQQLPKCGHCSTDQRFVCGDNGLTYHNRCFSQCAGVNLLSAGRCGKGPGLYHPLMV